MNWAASMLFVVARGSFTESLGVAGKIILAILATLLLVGLWASGGCALIGLGFFGLVLLGISMLLIAQGGVLGGIGIVLLLALILGGWLYWKHEVQPGNFKP